MCYLTSRGVRNGGLFLGFTVIKTRTVVFVDAVGSQTCSVTTALLTRGTNRNGFVVMPCLSAVASVTLCSANCLRMASPW